MEREDLEIGSKSLLVDEVGDGSSTTGLGAKVSMIVGLSSPSDSLGDMDNGGSKV